MDLGQSSTWLAEQMGWLSSIGARVAYSLILVSVAVLFLSEAYKVWFDRAQVLAAFAYNDAGKVNEAEGRDFALRLQQQQRFLLAMLSGQRKDPDEPIQLDDANVEFQGLQATEVKGSELEEVEIKIQGFDVGGLMTRLRQWVRAPNEISGRVDKLDGSYHVFARWTGHLSDARANGGRFYSQPHRNKNEAACDLAGHLVYSSIRDFYHRATVTSRESLKLTTVLLESMSDADFATFMCAWDAYQRLDADKLNTAIKSLKRLAERDVAYPPVYYLLARLILRNSPLAKVEKGKPHPETEALTKYLERYIALLKIQDTRDQRAEATLATIITREGAGTVIAAAQSQVIGDRQVVLAGASLGHERISVSTACCVVRDQAGKRYLLAAGYTFAESPEGAVVISPATADGGTPDNDRVGTFERLYERPEGGSVALILLDETAEASNAFGGGKEMKSVAAVPKPGETVSLYGRTSGLSQGQVGTLDVTLDIALKAGQTTKMSGLVLTDTRISQPGDSGAPVVDSQGRLVGMHYGASKDVSMFIPLKPIFDELKLELVVN